METKLKFSRRRFLAISAITGAAGAGLLIGFELQGREDEAKKLPSKLFEPNAWLRIEPNDMVTIQVAKSEMGQGVLTALAMLVAEELDVDWARVCVEQAPPDPRYGDQLTDGSSSVAESFPVLRRVGAEARTLLVAAAARVWSVDRTACHTEKGEVVHAASGRRLSYGRLAGAAAALTTPTGAIGLKDPTHFHLVGVPTPRLDTPGKVDGSAVFGLDVRVPGMLFATIARCPVLGGSVAHFDAARARAVLGVRQVVQVPSGVAVVAEHTWAAIRGRAALDITWNDGENTQLDSGGIRRRMATEAQRSSDEEDAGGAGAVRSIEAVYELPYLAHAMMEPLNCTARVEGNRCEVWVGTQDPRLAQLRASSESGAPQENVVVHLPFMGGGFGRRAGVDVVAEAVQVARAIGKPVQVVWTREDDLQHDTYRPATYHHLRGGVDAAGLPVAWRHTLVGASAGNRLTAGADLPYNVLAEVHDRPIELGVPVGIWRAVSYSHNTFAVESFLDELAAAGQRDPYELRLELLERFPRLKAVVRLAGEKAGWGTPLPAGRGRGIAACMFQISATAVAEVAEVSVAVDGSLQVHRVVCAVDCGRVINPLGAEAQAEGAIVYGLTAALKGEITLAHGRVQQGNFHDYPLLRMDEMPAIEVHFVPSEDGPYGLGEPALPAIAPAVANAIFAATGRRVRRLPIRPEDLR